MEKLKKINSFVLKIQESLMFVASILVASLIFIGAIMRYIFKTDFYGMEEILMIAAFWLYFIGSSYAAYEDSHINADLMSSMIHDSKKKAILSIVKYGLSLLISSITTVWCLQFILWNLKYNPKTPVYGIPLLFSQASLCISFILMTLYILGHLINSVKKYKVIDRGIE